jgi:hypothetical protein
MDKSYDSGMFTSFVEDAIAIDFYQKRRSKNKRGELNLRVATSREYLE